MAARAAGCNDVERRAERCGARIPEGIVAAHRRLVDRDRGLLDVGIRTGDGSVRREDDIRLRAGIGERRSARGVRADQPGPYPPRRHRRFGHGVSAGRQARRRSMAARAAGRNDVERRAERCGARILEGIVATHRRLVDRDRTQRRRRRQVCIRTGNGPVRDEVDIRLRAGIGERRCGRGVRADQPGLHPPRRHRRFGHGVSAGRQARRRSMAARAAGRNDVERRAERCGARIPEGIVATHRRLVDRNRTRKRRGQTHRDRVGVQRDGTIPRQELPAENTGAGIQGDARRARECSLRRAFPYRESPSCQPARIRCSSNLH